VTVDTDLLDRPLKKRDSGATPAAPGALFSSSPGTFAPEPLADYAQIEIEGPADSLSASDFSLSTIAAVACIVLLKLFLLWLLLVSI